MRAVSTIASLAFLALAACATNETKAPPKATTPTTPKVAAAPRPAESKADAPLPGTVKKPSTDPLYFSYDAHTLEPDAQARLRDIAAYLRENPGATVRISGHADERGTSEYNLALGDARSRAAREYLIKLGVAPERIRFETLGEEKPADPGHDETAWAKNRRDEIVFEG